MKTPLFFIAALVAFFLLPVDFTLMASVLFGAGIAAIVVADYRRDYPSVGTVSARVAAAQRHHLQLAA